MSEHTESRRWTIRVDCGGVRSEVRGPDTGLEEVEVIPADSPQVLSVDEATALAYMWMEMEAHGVGIPDYLEATRKRVSAWAGDNQ